MLESGSQLTISVCRTHRNFPVEPNCWDRRIIHRRSTLAAVLCTPRWCIWDIVGNRDEDCMSAVRTSRLKFTVLYDTGNLYAFLLPSCKLWRQAFSASSLVCCELQDHIPPIVNDGQGFKEGLMPRRTLVTVTYIIPRFLMLVAGYGQWILRLIRRSAPKRPDNLCEEHRDKEHFRRSGSLCNRRWIAMPLVRIS
jgi:hypothetical protein